MGAREEAQLVTALEKRCGRKSHAVFSRRVIDRGLPVRAGGLTIDGSLKSRLERLALELTA